MNITDLKSIDFYECRERYAITELFTHHLKPMFGGYSAELHLSKTFRSQIHNEVYDAIIYLRDRVTTNILYKFIVEVKFRDTDYDTLMLEQKRYKELLNAFEVANKYKHPLEDISVLYINFTPSGTYLFNILSDKMQKFLIPTNISVEKQTQYTFEADKKQINKKLFYIPKNLATHFPFKISSDYHLIYEIQNQPKEIEKTKTIIKTIVSLF